MYLIFLLLLMLVFTICFSIIIGKRKNNNLSSEKLTDDVKVIDNIDKNDEDFIVDEDII